MAKHSLRRRRRLTDSVLKKITLALAAAVSVLLVFTTVAVCVSIALKDDGERETAVQTHASFNALLFASGDNMSEPKAFVLCRLDTEREKIYITSLPPETLAEYDGRSDTLAGHMKYGGYLQVQRAVCSLLDIDTERYLRMRLEDFETLTDAMGGIIFDVPNPASRVPDSGIPIKVDPGLQTLTGPQAGAVFAGGAYGSELLTVQENLLCAAVNQYLNEDTLERAETHFKTAANLSETDISLFDLYDALPFLKKMAEDENAAETVPVSGSSKQQGGKTVFVPDADSAAALHSVYSDAD